MRRNLIIAIVLSPLLTFAGIIIYIFLPIILALLGGEGSGIGAMFGISLPFLLGINLIAFLLIFALLQWRSKKPLN